jgi:uncharacterized protein (DUF697 family)
MADGGDDEEEKPIGELFGQLIDEGKAYAKAEFGLVKATAEAKAEGAKNPALFGAAAVLFLVAGVVVLCMTLALALATLIGPLAGGLIAASVSLAIAYALYIFAMRELEKLK